MANYSDLVNSIDFVSVIGGIAAIAVGFFSVDFAIWGYHRVMVMLGRDFDEDEYGGMYSGGKVYLWDEDLDGHREFSSKEEYYEYMGIRGSDWS
ncbi:hypothetical protein ACUXVY_16400 [Chromobacterium haemolyticum]|uniref:hypothetical protein n=1 Tax=Chromobacterium haemolyticum TaxID=394935 RepID=UPI004056F810